MKAKPGTKWQEIDWPYSEDHAAELKSAGIKVFALQVGKGRVILKDDKYAHYTASFGPDNERSHSGCFFPEEPGLDEAKRSLETRDW